MTEFVRRSLVVLLLVALALLVWRIAYALLLAFGGVLVAVFLRGVGRKVREWTGLGMRTSLALVGFGLLASFVLAGTLIGPLLIGQLDELAQALSQGFAQVRGYLEGSGWGRHLLSTLEQAAPQGKTLMSALSNVLVSALDAVLGLVLVLFAGVYFALAPAVYTEGAVHLFPVKHHARVREILHTTGNALWRWLLGQFIVMLAVGVLTAIGLLLLGVPLALALGLVTGLLEFVPYLGPIAAAVPVVLVALTVNPQTALYALLFFFALQQAESNLLEPLVQRRVISLPPVLILVGTIAITLLFGLLGAIFATPLLLVAVVWVKMLYLEDALGERVSVPGAERER